MRQSFHEYAGESVKHSFWARAYYEQQIAKGKSRQAGGASVGLQMDQNHLEVLANPHALQRSEVPRGAIHTFIDFQKTRCVLLGSAKRF